MYFSSGNIRDAPIINLWINFPWKIALLSNPYRWSHHSLPIFDTVLFFHNLSLRLARSLFFTTPFSLFHLSRKHFLALSRPLLRPSLRPSHSFSHSHPSCCILFATFLVALFTLLFLFSPSSFFRPFASRYLLSSSQPLSHETHVSEMPRYEGSSN